MLRATLLLLAFIVPPLLAQEPPCGIRSLTATVVPVYPPIARAARVSGTVLLMATFDLRGKVAEVHAVSGPVMLQKPAETFVSGWSADEYTGPRSCPVVVTYELVGDTFCSDEDAKNAYIEPPHRTDTQHYRVPAMRTPCVILQV